MKQKDEKEGAGSVVGRIDSRNFIGVTGILQKRNRREETIATLIRADDFLSKWLRIHKKTKSPLSVQQELRMGKKY